MQRRILWRRKLYLLSLPMMFLLAFSMASVTAARAPKGKQSTTYDNPLTVTSAKHGVVESCADPEIIEGQGKDPYWYMYCTTDPLNADDRDADGNLIFHLIPMFRSLDLVNWEYMGDAFDRDPSTEKTSDPPSWAAPTAGIWAPEVDYIDGTYYLFFGVTDVTDETSGEANCPFDNAIGYATSASPLGPWEPANEPLIEPRRGGGGCNFFWTYDPEVIEDAENPGQYYIYYGSYYGGIFVRPLEVGDDGSLSTDPAEAVQVTIANRYEGAEVVYRDGYYYLFVSATNCCNGPLTAYSVFVGRSASPTGPFVDREGVSLLDTQVGGTPFIMQNGNRWVGAGHNTVFQDEAGQWWTIYHAVDRFDPYFEGATGFTKRPVLLDAIDWINGWPTLNGGSGPSDEPQPAPAAQPGDKSKHKVRTPIADRLGKLIYAEEFNGETTDLDWTWVREPAEGTYGLEDGTLRFETQAADLFVNNNSASVLTLPATDGDYVVETRLRLNVPPDGCCFNYVQAGLVAYSDDDNFIKLVHVSIWETRQTEFAKEEFPVPAGFPRYGNTVTGPPAQSPDEWTYLRIVKREAASPHGEDTYTAYTSTDGQTWVRGGTWTHELGDDERIGLVSMGGSGFVANFDYVRVYELQPGKVRTKQ